ncbi:MAG: outer membrane lipoprotein carrier protein LolA [Proteobacteria bacterium]|nr:outer membrane lipoprotein carrier protein LolA [Pseudomonadota bacterium]MBU1736550.1 outer membrane lipoprotein carrier protein LolA [Pseudomonadota bacterium]
MVKKICMICIFLVLPGFSSAGEESVEKLTPEQLAVKLQEAYSRTVTFQAEFNQITTIKLSRRKRSGEGNLLISKPGLMRWDYLTPDKQVLICDGKLVKMYFAKAEQMMIISAHDYLQSDVTYDFFAGKGDIVRDFAVGPPGEDFCCGEPPDLKLVPKVQHPQVDHIYLWLTDDFLIRKMHVNDHYGSQTELVFTGIKLNEHIDASRFLFDPPEGTEIIEQLAPEDQGNGN